MEEEETEADELSDAAISMVDALNVSLDDTLSVQAALRASGNEALRDATVEDYLLLDSEVTTAAVFAEQANMTVDATTPMPGGDVNSTILDNQTSAVENETFIEDDDYYWFRRVGHYYYLKEVAETNSTESTLDALSTIPGGGGSDVLPDNSNSAVGDESFADDSASAETNATLTDGNTLESDSAEQDTITTVDATPLILGSNANSTSLDDQSLTVGNEQCVAFGREPRGRRRHDARHEQHS